MAIKMDKLINDLKSILKQLDTLEKRVVNLEGSVRMLDDVTIDHESRLQDLEEERDDED